MDTDLARRRRSILRRGQPVNASASLPLLVLATSLLPGLVIFFLRESSVTFRTALNLLGAVAKLALVLAMLWGVYNGAQYEVRIQFLPELDLVLRADAKALLFLTLSAGLWFVTTIYAIGYLEHAPHRSRFFGFFSICVTATCGVALAGNLITFFLFYELLTLVTYPLIVHRGSEAARVAGRIYLRYTMTGGALLLLGTVWLYSLSGTLEFTHHGFLDNEGAPAASPEILIFVFVVLISGLGVKAALVPLHGWLPQAMVAPAPVSALLHAVAVVKAGAFGFIRIIYDVYGIEFAASLGVTTPLAIMASTTIVYASMRACYQDDLKRRLAYSTVSQISYIALGIATVGPIASIGGIVHLVHQGIMKITLFFCAGNLAETLGIHRISEMNGVAQRMPWTMAAFTVGALGMIGIPPLAGFFSKWYLGTGALAAGQSWILLILVASSLLNAVYFLPVLHAAWFRGSAGPWPAERLRGRLETHWMLLLPTMLMALLVLAVGLLANAPFSPLEWARYIAEKEFGQ